MLKGFYTAASGMLMQQRVMNSLSNNIVNARTPGARAQRLISSTFEQKLINRIETGNTQGIGSGSAARIVSTEFTNYDQGFVDETGRPFDFAIEGEGFFSVNYAKPGTEVQIGYTRNGNFDIDESGYLVLRGVGRVLGEKGEIHLGTSDFTVLNNGTVYNANGTVIDKLRLRNPQSTEDLIGITNGLYSNKNEDAATDTVNEKPIAVLQGFYERSNIDMNREYTLVMEAQRAFQSCSTALKMIDNINQKTATAIGSL